MLPKKDVGAARALRWLLITAATLSAVPAPANPLHDAIGAPETFKLSGSMRSRTELIDGQFRRRAAEDDQFWSIRTAIFGEYDAGPVRLGGELIDARGYGQDADSSAGAGEVNAVELVQAYGAADLENVFGEGDVASIQAGRFVYQVGAGRIIAIQNFRNAANGFTGVNVDWRSKSGDRLQALWSMPQIRRPEDREAIEHNRVHWDRETTHLQLYGANFTKAGLIPGATLEIYAFGLTERDSAGRPTRNRRLITPGVRIARKPGEGAFDFDIEAIHQFGKIRASSSPADREDLDVSASYLHAEVGKRFAGGWSPRLAIVFDYGSGDDGKAGRYGRFDSLFGSARSDLGPSGLYGALGRSNIVAPGVRFDAKSNARWDGFVAYRELWLDEPTDSFASTGVRDAAGASGAYAGRQIEGRVRYWLIPKVAQFELGAAWLGKGSFLKSAPNAPATGDARYGYADLTFTF